MSKLKFFILSLFLPFFCLSEDKLTIINSLGDRLGDNILNYAHAKWISYKWGIPLLYQPFPYSDLFIFHDIENKVTPQKLAFFQYKGSLLDLSILNQKFDEYVLYAIPHCVDSYDEYVFINWQIYSPYIDVDWNDEKFRRMMKLFIQPKKPLNLILPPKDIISVALHYRTGGGYDTPDARIILPLRFPEPEYYIEQLHTLYSLVNYAPMYIYIFTDHQDPLTVKKMFQEHCPFNNVQFDCREVGNRHDANVLEDVFSMMQFDCFIRSVSHYALIASHLGDFEIEIFPQHGYWKNEKFVVDKVQIIQKKFLDSIQKI